MPQQTMYPGMINSPQTELAAAITDTDDTIELVDVSALPPAPNLATIGADETAETVLNTGVSGNDLTGVTRGIEGAAKSWSIGAKIARNFTHSDLDAVQKNIVDLDAELAAQKAESVSGYINVVGASGADQTGETDSSAAFADALSKLSDGGVLYLPCGVYSLATWTIKSITKDIKIIGDKATIVGPGSVGFIYNYKSMHVEGVTFKDFNRVLQVGDNTAARNLNVVDCEFRDCNQPIYVDDLKSQYVNVDRCRFYNSSSYPIRINGFDMHRVRITDCDIDGAGGRGIYLGSGSNYTGIRNMIVTGNTVKNVTGEAGEDTKGIIAYGLNVIVEGNIVENVSASDGLGGNNDGIYVKTKRATIANNQLLNAGRTEGSIVLKFDGVETSEYESVVSGNIIRFSGLSVDTTGISVKQPNVVVMGNTIEGATNGVIVGNSNDGMVHTVKLANNIIRECRYAVLVLGNTSNIDIRDNDIINSASAVSTDNVLTIGGYGKNYTVEGNSFFNNVLNEASIYVSPNGSGTMTLEDIRILNNEIINAVACTYGVHLLAATTGYIVQNVDIKGNTITNCYGGVRMRVGGGAGTVNNINIFDSTFRTVTTGILLSNTPTNIRAMNNEGFTTEASGTVTLPSGATSIGVAPFATFPGFALSLGDFMAVPTASLGSASKFWVTVAASNQFNINVDVAPGGSGVVFAWKYKFDRKLNPA